MPVADEAVWLAVVLVADVTVPFEDPPDPVSPEPLPDPDSLPDPLEPVATAAAPVAVAGTRAATPVEPCSVTVENTTWGTVRTEEIMMVVLDPMIVAPWLTPAV